MHSTNNTVIWFVKMKKTELMCGFVREIVPIGIVMHFVIYFAECYCILCIAFPIKIIFAWTTESLPISYRAYLGIQQAAFVIGGHHLFHFIAQQRCVIFSTPGSPGIE